MLTYKTHIIINQFQHKFVVFYTRAYAILKLINAAVIAFPSSIPFRLRVKIVEWRNITGNHAVPELLCVSSYYCGLADHSPLYWSR
jgi:hypothetical protein